MKINDKRYLKLIELLGRYNYEYHSLDKPTVSDAVYDSFLKQIKDYEARFPNKIDPNSPSQKVGSKPKEVFRKIGHKKPMLSLNDVFDWSGVLSWDKRLKKIQSELTAKLKLEKIDYFLDFKMDGLALAVIYENGVLKKAITRGDGRQGEDVSQNAKTIANLPHRLPNSQLGQSRRLEVRGEVVIYKKDFSKFNQGQKAANQAHYANPRNTAAGSLRQLDSKLVAKRPLTFLAYDLIGPKFKSHQEIYQALASLRIPHNSSAKKVATISQLQKEINRREKIAKKLRFETDGIVVKIDNFKLHQAFGTVGRAPRGALAYKYPPERTTTIIEKIELQVGRTGRVTPVAIFTPSRIAGTIVKRASLHNADEIQRLDVRLGDTVVVYKAGDIIPKVEEVIKKLRPDKSQRFNFEKELKRQHPQLEFERPPGQVAWQLAVSQNQDRLIDQISHYASRSALDIVGLSKKTAEKLVVAGAVRRLPDIYNLRLPVLEKIEGLGQKSGQNLLKAIEKSLQKSLQKFLIGLGIPGFGPENSQLFLEQHPVFEQGVSIAQLPTKIKDLTPDSLTSIKGLGPVVAASFCQWRDQNIAMVEDLAKNNWTASGRPTKKTRPAGLQVVGQPNFYNSSQVGRNFLAKEAAKTKKSFKSLLALNLDASFWPTDSFKIAKSLKDVPLKSPFVAQPLKEALSRELEQNRDLAKKLTAQIIALEKINSKKKSFDLVNLAGCQLVISGKIEPFSRSQLKEAVSLVGAEAKSSLSLKTDYLVVGQNPGAEKIKAAKNYQTKVLDESKFLNSLGLKLLLNLVYF